jgi:hypothetical protein
MTGDDQECPTRATLSLTALAAMIVLSIPMMRGG